MRSIFRTYVISVISSGIAFQDYVSHVEEMLLKNQSRYRLSYKFVDQIRQYLQGLTFNKITLDTVSGLHDPIKSSEFCGFVVVQIFIVIQIFGRLLVVNPLTPDSVNAILNPMLQILNIGK